MGYSGYSGDVVGEMKKAEESRAQDIEAIARGHELEEEEVLHISPLLVVGMHKRINTWAATSAALGGLSLLAGALNSGWGVMMLIIAVLCWRVKTASMFILYSVAMAWAALSNGLAALDGGGNMLWLGLGLMQVYWVVSLVRQYRIYQRLPLRAMYEAKQWPVGLSAPPDGEVVTKWFGIAGMFVGGLALLMLPGIFVVNMAWRFLTGMHIPFEILSYLFVVIPDLAVLAVGLSAAAMATRDGKKAWGVGGVVLGGINLVLWLGIVLLDVLS